MTNCQNAKLKCLIYECQILIGELNELASTIELHIQQRPRIETDFEYQHSKYLHRAKLLNKEFLSLNV